MRTLWTTIFPALVVAGSLVVAYMVRQPDSGIAVRASEPTYVRITKPGRRETIAGGRFSRGETLRLRLEPGRYVVRAQTHGRRRARAVEVYVRDGRFAPVRLRYRRASGSAAG